MSADKNLSMADHSMSERAIIVSSECMDRIACETYLSLFIHELPYFGANKCSNCEVPQPTQGSECDAKPETCQWTVCLSHSCSPCYDFFHIRVLRVMTFRAE